MNRTLSALAAAVFVLLTFAQAPARADEPAADPPTSAETAPEPYDADALSRDGFVPAEPGTGESVPGGQFLAIAYGLIWALMLLYVVSLVRRQRAVNGELAELTRRLDEIDDRLDDAGA